MDWLRERGRQGTDELLETIRSEIRCQVKALGLATRDDVARLEAKIDALATPPARPRSTGPVRKAAGITKAASARKAAPVRKAQRPEG